MPHYPAIPDLNLCITLGQRFYHSSHSSLHSPLPLRSPILRISQDSEDSYSNTVRSNCMCIHTKKGLDGASRQKHYWVQGQTVRNSAAPDVLQPPASRCVSLGRDCRPSRRRLPANWRYHRIYGANHACKPVRHGPRCPDTDFDRGLAAHRGQSAFSPPTSRTKMWACLYSASSPSPTSFSPSYNVRPPSPGLQRPDGIRQRENRPAPTV